MGGLTLEVARGVLGDNNVSRRRGRLCVCNLFVVVSRIVFFTFSYTLKLVFNYFMRDIVFCVSFTTVEGFTNNCRTTARTEYRVSSTLSLLTYIKIVQLSGVCSFEATLLYTTTIYTILVFTFYPLSAPRGPLNRGRFGCFHGISYVVLFMVYDTVVTTFIFGIGLIFIPYYTTLILRNILVATNGTRGILNNGGRGDSSFRSIWGVGFLPV